MAECLKCGHKWNPRLERPARCPKCLTKYWDIPGRGSGKGKVQSSEMLTLVDERLRSEIIENCNSCGEPLLRTRWNPQSDIQSCDNFACDRFRQPVPFTKRPGVLPEEFFTLASKSKIKGQKYESKEKSTESESLTLQGMRDRILAQRQTPKIP